MAARTIAFGNVSSIKAKKPAARFITARTGAGDRRSSPTVMAAAIFNADEDVREIRVFCEDGNMRRCKVDRMLGADGKPDIEVARALWRKLTKIGTTKTVVFVAAGGFNPDMWFYDVEVQK